MAPTHADDEMMVMCRLRQLHTTIVSNVLAYCLRQFGELKDRPRSELQRRQTA